MRKGLLISLLFLISFIMLGCSEEHPNGANTENVKVEYDKELKLYFSSNSEVGSEISPFIYGTFIEHMERIIYEGLWAEEIMDRKFVAPIGEDVSQWKKGADKLIVSDNVNTYSGGYSPYFIKGATIYQSGIILHDDNYSGYFYAKGNGGLKISLLSTNGEKVEKTFVINSKGSFSKYEYEIAVPAEGKYRLIFECLSGSFNLDSLSLMKSDNYYGMRKDTLELLKQLNAPFYRWPGGNFVSGYDFYDGIGDRDKRVSKRNLEYAGQLSDFKSDADRLAADLTNIQDLGFYSVYDSNDFGIDEFITMCRYLETEPNIVLNAGLGSVQMAKDEVEYINGTSGYYASLRPQKDPYNVTYFSIGNEMNGEWQLGHMSLSSYVKKHNDIANAIKQVSPNIKIIGVGDNISNWTQTMINSCRNNMNLTSEHFYAERNEESVKDHILSLKRQAEWRINQHRNLNNPTNIKMAIDEYAYENAKSSSRLKDGMGIASCLNTFIENSDVIEVACYSSTINAVQGQIITDDLNAYMQGSGMVNSLYSTYMQDYHFKISFQARDFEDYIEVCGTINYEKNTITISIINTSDLRLKITNANIKNIISRSYMISESFEGINSSDAQELIIVTNDTSAYKGIVEPRSVTLITFEI